MRTTAPSRQSFPENAATDNIFISFVKYEQYDDDDIEGDRIPTILTDVHCEIYLYANTNIRKRCKTGYVLIVPLIFIIQWVHVYIRGVFKK